MSLLKVVDEVDWSACSPSPIPGGHRYPVSPCRLSTTNVGTQSLFRGQVLRAVQANCKPLVSSRFGSAIHPVCRRFQHLMGCQKEKASSCQRSHRSGRKLLSNSIALWFLAADCISLWDISPSDVECSPTKALC